MLLTGDGQLAGQRTTGPGNKLVGDFFSPGGVRASVSTGEITTGENLYSRQ